jgi:hypothetical protein
MSPKNRRIVRWVLLLILVNAILVPLYLGHKLSIGRHVAVTISRETTYITEPLRADGYPDYVAALNQRMSTGVTPENNAAALFWKAMGPAKIDSKDREKYFKMLGIPPLPEQGDYFVTLDEYSHRQKHAGKPADAGAEHPKSEEEEHERIWGQLQLAMKRRWSKKEFPILADWLEANEKPLALLLETSKRPRRYDPLICGEPDVAIGVPLPAADQYRDVVRALAARAMLRMDEGNVDEGWNDLLACHRLARLVGQGPTLVEALVAVATNAVADNADQGMLQSHNLKAEQLTKMRNDLDQLPPMPKMVDKIDPSERFTFLDAVAFTAREGLSSFPAVTGDGNVKQKGVVPSLVDSVGSVVDWDVVLRMGNSWYDRLADAYRKPPRAERKAALEKLDEEIRKVAAAARDWKSLAASVLGLGRQAVSERVGQVFVALFLPALSTCANAEDRGMMQFELTKLAFALAAYRADNGSYPEKLADLMPKYVAEVPKDIFADAELHYAREADGYLLYSVGVNGKDDGAKSYDDRKEGEDWDDLVVRVPATAGQKQK